MLYILFAACCIFCLQRILYFIFYLQCVVHFVFSVLCILFAVCSIFVTLHGKTYFNVIAFKCEKNAIKTMFKLHWNATRTLCDIFSNDELTPLVGGVNTV